MHRHRIPFLLVLVSALVILVGCSSDTPVTPSETPEFSIRAQAEHDFARSMWGMWEVTIDLENEELIAVPMRTADLHFNVIPLLKEGTPKSSITFGNLLVDPTSRKVSIDVSLTHPIPNAPQVAGFDVRGILFTRGGSYELDVSNVRMTNPGEPRLVNADGYTRWWNPSEFHMHGVLGYNDGLYGTPNAVGMYPINLAGYKYFADSLEPLDSMNDLDSVDRGVFRAGSTNTRRYLIDFGSEAGNFLVFNYAVDACWGLIPGFEPGGPDPIVPDDFPLTANCPEPYRINVTESMNTFSATQLSGTSGDVHLNINVYDWQAMDPYSTVPMEITEVLVEIPALGTGALNATVVDGSGTGGHMSTYEAIIAGFSPDKYEELDVVVAATCSEGKYQQDLTNFLSDDPTQAFFVKSVPVLDADVYSGWNYRYTKLLYPEQPDQGENNPDLAVYKFQNNVHVAMIDQENPDPNNEGGHMPDSVTVWTNDYDTWSLPEHYHLPLDPLSDTGLWDDIAGISVCDMSNRLFFTTTSINNEFPDGETDPLYSYFNWVTHDYLGNAPAAAWSTVFFSADDYPRYWATDPSNGVQSTNDFMYSVFIYDTTGMSGTNPSPNPQRYIILRWKPLYQPDLNDCRWQRPDNVTPQGTGPGYVDIGQPYDHRLAVDDWTGKARCYILDSMDEIEVVECDFAQDEFSGYTAIGTVTIPNWPVEITDIVDLEVVQTRDLGTTRNHVAALCEGASANTWRVWVFDFDQTQAEDQKAQTVWLSEEYAGVPCSLDAVEDPYEVHVLHRNGTMVNVSMFRNYP